MKQAIREFTQGGRVQDPQGVRDGWGRRRRLVGGVLVSAVLLAAVGCGDDDDGADGAAASDDAASNESLLGPIDAAEGESVKVGFIGDGQSAAGDNQIELDVAEATIAYLNEHKAGIAGRPIELVICEAQSDPGRATDCGNQMVEEGVVVVGIGATGVFESAWRPLSEAGVPVVFFSGSGEAILSEPDSTFAFGSPAFSNVSFPISVAEEEGADKVTAVVIDVPAAVDGYDAADFEDAGLEFELVRVPVGTADMIPQLQAIADDPGVVHIVGNDTFCISALQALEALAYDGPITMLNFCISDATREAFTSGYLEGIRMPLTAPAGDDDASALYRAAMDAFATTDIDFSNQGAVNTFVLFAGIDVAVEGLEGEVTPESVIAAMRSMPESELPNGGGIQFRCDGTAEDGHPAVCTTDGLATELDAEGRPTDVQVVSLG